MTLTEKVMTAKPTCKIDAFILAAHFTYCAKTQLSFEILSSNGYLGYYQYDWADDNGETDFSDMQDAIDQGENKAIDYIMEETND